LVCGTGVGMSIASNKINGIRSVLTDSLFVATKSREHNDSNILCLGSWVVKKNKVINIINSWLKSSFKKGRHIKRVNKIETDKKREKIVMCNGVFDLLHRGHIELLNYAKKIGTKVVVAINSDSSVRKIKGKNRPFINEQERKKILLSMSCIDEVVIFDEINISTIIQKIKPNILLRGDDYSVKEIRKRDSLNPEIKIKIFKKIKGISTTEISKKIYKKIN
jgi:D-beta-D-heptose 7-phosphate kinase/D-beta-D-heptose 1-phosphate adenosyltransferase